MRGLLKGLMLAGWVGMTGCGAPEETPAPQQEEVPGGRVSSLDTIPLSVNEGSTWPKTVTWCGGDGHQGHTSYQWSVSWGLNQTTSTNCVSRSVSVETCNLRARVLTDSAGHTSVDSYRSVYDYRSFSVSPSSYSLQVGQSASLVAPTPHRTRHCDVTGRFAWEVVSGGVWTEVPSSVNVTSWSVSSPTAGTETYRLKCTHGGNTHYSNQVTVTWSASVPLPPYASVECNALFSTASCEGTVVRDGVPPYTYQWQLNGGSWQAGSTTSSFSCSPECTVGFRFVDSVGTVSISDECTYQKGGGACVCHY